MGGPEIEASLTHLAAKRKVSASTQNQALNAIVFLYKLILARDPGQCNAIRARRRKRLPVVPVAGGGGRAAIALRTALNAFSGSGGHESR